jgi:hypothetical protein
MAAWFGVDKGIEADKGVVWGVATLFDVALLAVSLGEQALRPMNADIPSEILRNLNEAGSMEKNSFQQIILQLPWQELIIMASSKSFE